MSNSFEHRWKIKAARINRNYYSKYYEDLLSLPCYPKGKQGTLKKILQASGMTQPVITRQARILYAIWLMKEYEKILRVRTPDSWSTHDGRLLDLQMQNSLDRRKGAQ